MSVEAEETAPPVPSVVPRRAPNSRQDPPWVRRTLIGLAVGFLGVLVVVPVVNVFVLALARGPWAYLEKLFGDPDTRAAVLLTLVVAPTSVVLNTLFGLAAAWAIARFRFPGRTALLTCIDLPFSVSPVVAGLMFVLIFGLQGYLGGPLQQTPRSAAVAGVLVFLALAVAFAARWRPVRRYAILLAIGLATSAAASWLVGPSGQLGAWLAGRGVSVLFAVPGLVIATTFVTLPFVARELIPLMEAQGPDEELAAVSLGATGWQIFWRITLPNIQWGLLYGVILANARAMGEFGAVYVVGGRITGQTDTMPLRVEKLFQEADMTGSFALASLLTGLALVTLLLKVLVERAAEEK
jgi:sulfate transport system permease protein